jgi:purine-nucleoside phosphorylase
MSGNLRERIEHTAELVRVQLPPGWTPEVGIILGSGLGALAEEVRPVATLNYSSLPGFAFSTVQGHAGRLVLGTMEDKRLVVMQGRFHFYEGHDLQHTTFPVRVMRALGVHTLVVTNAAGGLNPDFQAGDLMLINDHINMLGWGGQNPLIGPNDLHLGPRFPDMSQVYDPELMRIAQEVAGECNIELRQGVYIVLAGPNFETPAELRLLRQWGADAVGMSTVPEVLVARHGGMRVLGISAITNMALGSAEPATHEEVLEVAEQVRPRFIQLMKTLVPKL